ncbi:MAG TPA: hypothetical protein VGL90_01580 [Casimicrobiaceae bacterium]
MHLHQFAPRRVERVGGAGGKMKIAAFGGEGARGGEPDAFRRARDQNRLAREPQIHPRTFLYTKSIVSHTIAAVKR